MLATQTLAQPKPKSMRIRYDGRARLRRHRQGPDPRHDRPDGHQRRRRPRRRVRRRRSIEALSMEGRMTICNMTIEGGGRAGMIAPDDTTFEWVEGRPGAPRGLRGGASPTGATLRTDDGATFDQRDRRRRGRALPARHLGHEPRRRSSRSPRPCPQPRTETDERALSTWASSPARRCRSITLDRVFIGSCTNSRHRRPARRRASGQGPQGRRDVDAMVVPGSQQVRAQAEAGGPRRGLPRRRLRLAHRRLLDVPGHEPGHPRARRALRLDLEPQLRGPPGPRRAHPPRLARRWPPRPPSRATSSTSGSGADGARHA